MVAFALLLWGVDLLSGGDDDDEGGAVADVYWAFDLCPSESSEGGGVLAWESVPLLPAELCPVRAQAQPVRMAVQLDDVAPSSAFTLAALRPASLAGEVVVRVLAADGRVLLPPTSHRFERAAHGRQLASAERADGGRSAAVTGAPMPTARGLLKGGTFGGFHAWHSPGASGYHTSGYRTWGRFRPWGAAHWRSAGGQAGATPPGLGLVRALRSAAHAAEPACAAAPSVGGSAVGGAPARSECVACLDSAQHVREPLGGAAMGDGAAAAARGGVGGAGESTAAAAGGGAPDAAVFSAQAPDFPLALELLSARLIEPVPPASDPSAPAADPGRLSFGLQGAVPLAALPAGSAQRGAGAGWGNRTAVAEVCDRTRGRAELLAGWRAHWQRHDGAVAADPGPGVGGAPAVIPVPARPPPPELMFTLVPAPADG